MISMQDIAVRLGVSKATVSLVLSGKAGSRVSDGMKEKVLKTAKEMGYHVNDLARSLRTGRSNVIGVLVTDISNEFFGKMSFHIQEEAKRYGYVVITANTNESDEELRSMVKTLVSKQVDGMIIVPTQGSRDDLKMMADGGVPLVQIDRRIDSLDADYVGTCNYESTYQAIEKVIESGKVRIGMVTLDLEVNAITERRAGFEDALRAHGMFDPDLVKAVDFDTLDKIEAALTELASEKPDALFFSSRRVFTKAMEVLAARKGLISEDATLICFDEARSYMNMTGHDLWYIEQPIEMMAKKAFSLLIDNIEGNTVHGSHTFMSTLVTE